MNWYDLVPHQVAKYQYSWEKNQRILRARKAGMKQSELARRFNQSRSNIYSKCKYALRHAHSPIEEWLDDDSDIQQLYNKMIQLERRKPKTKPRESKQKRQQFE